MLKSHQRSITVITNTHACGCNVMVSVTHLSSRNIEPFRLVLEGAECGEECGEEDRVIAHAVIGNGVDVFILLYS